MADPDDTLAPDSAAEVWKRAAQLQAEAARRLEERSRALAMPGEPASAHPDHFTLAEVRAAAAGAGIAPEFVELAVAELRQGPGEALTPRQERAANRWLGSRQRRLEVSRTVGFPAGQVFVALQRVLPGHPWYLCLEDVSGDPVAGGVLTFALPGLAETSQAALAWDAAALDLRQVRVMLRPGRGGADSCELVVSAGLDRSLRLNSRVAVACTGALGAVGGGGSVALAAAAGLAGGLLALPAAAGAALLGGGTALGYRALYHYSLRAFTRSLERMLQGVDVHARTGGGFAPPPRTRGADGMNGAAGLVVPTPD